MITPYFSSTTTKLLYQVVIDLLNEAVVLSKKHTVELQIMCFNFTEELIYERIKTIALENPKMTIKILADWGNISQENDRKIHLLAKLNLPNLRVRLKYDQPYLWDTAQQKLLWNYNASLGMLHHRTLLVLKNNQPIALQSGSYNWTKQANRNYENIIQFSSTNSNKDNTELLKCFQKEFTFLWSNTSLTLSFKSGLQYLDKFANELKSNKEVALPFGLTNDDIQENTLQQKTLPKSEIDSSILVGFNSKYPSQENGNGFHQYNSSRSFNLRKTSGIVHKAPITITTLTLDLINAAKRNETIYLAMFALSYRTAEYNALLQAARRGVRLRYILDRNANEEVMDKLQKTASKERLHIKIRSGKKVMHQKYLVNISTGDIVTGTANMTTDATDRHWEHRILFRNKKALATQFILDFETIWERISLSKYKK
ncbi:phospholipase D-like domain-containing protein [Aquimarina brevivitae]|uniref:phospholipase D n=1 Tax=Aquimarina brevivitae TaxID=323412 RepID=A0A4Q7PIC6_9FLAO|nr:phospholipase D-like domain-containing protein [Aquimarina brevivitae]RZT00335.1 phospholipase D-like protein [Aquimarina brevivitae]